MDDVVGILDPVMSWMFGLGLLGCLCVIPVVAWRLFAVFFERDTPEEQQKPQ